MIIDAHQHFWKLDRGDYSWLKPEFTALYRDFEPHDLRPLLDAAEVDGTIAVQAADTEAETRFLLSLADQHEWIVGVVGWTDLEADDASAAIANLAQRGKLVGLRPMIQDIADDAWMLKESLRPAIRSMVEHDLTFDALVHPRHLDHLATFLNRYPDLRVVIDHGAKPDIGGQRFEGWAEKLSAIADRQNVFCKLSGLVTEAATNWQPSDLAPYISHIEQIFGPDRTLFGSDWPVLNLASDYASWKEIADKSFGGNVVDIYTSSIEAAYPRVGEVST
ncbi:amidohydrolase family protein [Shimia sp. Alg240-R146]|uniref:amidohydrolase family protein n=1 Tax=Shimia sp. Alg240-R146 TaxID=2993449 RepID=UPI0022E06E6E|nr:amidohydrolase family protein [Shimia sp. Alg240-R146]